MDQQAATLLATLKRTAASPESKLTLLNTLKSDIKHYRVPDNAQPTIFECLKIAIHQQSSSNIISAAFSTLSHLVKRLKIQDAEGKSIASLAPKLLPALHERLGDQRDAYRQGASQALTDLWPFCAHDVEQLVREEAIDGANVRAKQEGMHWVVKMNQEAGLQFKGFVSTMVACLEDRDESVREAAKGALVELFRPASTPAKNDLKKQLRLHDVRTSIASQILQQIGLGASSATTNQPPEVDLAASTRSLPNFDHVAQFAASINSEEARPPPQEEVPMDPLFVNSQHELEDIFRDMGPHFEGRESEENWLLRDKDVTKLRRLTKGNAPSEYHNTYMSGIKHLQEGTLKAANSLRTTMATNACHLVQELARTLGPAMDSMTEVYLQSFVKVCAATKQIAAQNGNQTVDTIFQYVSYNVRLVQHISLASQDKNKSPRQFAAGWLRTLLNRQAGSKTHFESSGGLELAEKTMRKCLEDADPKVKESMRATYWAYAKLWPERAETMINSVDSKIKSALEKDSHNPNAAKPTSHSAFSASTTSRPGGARSSLRDRIAADKKAAARQGPPRPATSMASMTPAKSKSMANLATGPKAQSMAPPVMSRVASNASVTSTATTKSIESTSSSSTATVRPNSLMSGAARRPVKRPELARPQTADPYATRKVVRPETPSNHSPANSPRNSTVGRSAAASTAASRNRVVRDASPAASPLQHPPLAKPAAASRSGSRDARDVPTEDPTLLPPDDFTMVLPTASHRDMPISSVRRRPGIDKAMSVDSGIPAMSDDDNFTMVMPDLKPASGRQREGSPLAFRTSTRGGGDETSQIPQTNSPRHTNHAAAQASPSVKSHSPSAIRSPIRRSTQQEEQRRDTRQDDRQLSGRLRAGSPLKRSVSPAVMPEEVQIYEDPFNIDTRDQPMQDNEVSHAPSVLTELPINENQRPESPVPVTLAPAHEESDANEGALNGEGQNGTLSPPRSPQSKAEALRTRKLLQSGIERIRVRTLDSHGFRKVLDLTRNNEPLDLFGSHTESKRYDDLMSALCDYIAQPTDSAASAANRKPNPASQSQDLKRQASNLLRNLLCSDKPQYKKWNSAGSWPRRVLASSLEARKSIDGQGMVVKDIETLVSECVRLCGPDTSIATVSEFLARAPRPSSTPTDSSPPPERSSTDKASAHASALALKTLSAVIANDKPSSSPSTTPSTATAATTNGTDKDESIPNGASRSPDAIPPSLTTDRAHSLSALSSLHLRSPDAEVRKAAVELATNLYMHWPEKSRDGNDEAEARSVESASGAGASHVNGDTNHAHSQGHGHSDNDRESRERKPDFWAALEGRKGHGRSQGVLDESMRNLLLYFIARREGQVRAC